MTPGSGGSWSRTGTPVPPGGTDTVDLEHAVVGGDAGNLRAEGPATNPKGEPFTLRVFWDENQMRAGQTWYGSLTLVAAPGGTEIGTIPVTVNRFRTTSPSPPTVTRQRRARPSPTRWRSSPT